MIAVARNIHFALSLFTMQPTGSVLMYNYDEISGWTRWMTVNLTPFI